MKRSADFCEELASFKPRVEKLFEVAERLAYDISVVIDCAQEDLSEHNEADESGNGDDDN